MAEKIPLLYISDIYVENLIYPSQVQALLPYFEQQFKLTSLFFSAAHPDELSERKLVLKGVRGLFITPLMLAFLFLKRRKINSLFKGATPQVILGRGAKGALAAILINKFFLRGGAKVVADVRGDMLDENRYRRLHQIVLTHLEKKLTKDSRAIFCVSSFLADILAKRTAFDRNKISVFPTIVDTDKFFYQNQTAEYFRKKVLGYTESDIVFVYSGNLGWYQNIEFIVSSFIASANKQIRLLLLTNNPAKASSWIPKAETRVRIEKLAHDEVGKYLQACDYGLLIRDPVPTNLSASPTKFGEYINSGLTVVMNSIPSDYCRQATELSLNTVLLEKKEDLKTFFEQVNNRPNKLPRVINDARSVADKEAKVISTLAVSAGSDKS